MRILFFLLFFLNVCFGYEKTFAFKDYKEAKQSENFLRFDMKSTKLGLLTSEFTGFVKNFKITDQGVISFPIQSMDTDVNARNEKMWEKCLGFDSNKSEDENSIVVKFKEPITSLPKDIPAQILIRGKWHEINVHLEGEMGSQISLKGTSKVSLKNLEIPDPSIVVATVNDEVNISFSLHFTK